MKESNRSKKFIGKVCILIGIVGALCVLFKVIDGGNGLSVALISACFTALGALLYLGGSCLDDDTQNNNSVDKKE